jgi:oligosaccharide repeat unit polymerase
MTALDSFAPALFFIAFALCGVMLTRALGQGALNPVSVQATVWAVLAVLAVMTVTDFQPMQLATWALMFASTGALALGSTHAWLFLGALSRRRPATEPIRSVLYSERTLHRAFYFALAALVAYVAIQFTRPSVLSLLRSVGGIKGILMGGGLEYRYAYVALSLKQSESGLSGIGLVVAVLGYVLFVPAMLLICMTGHFALKGHWWKVALPLVIMAVYSAISLERAVFIHAFLICFLSCYYHSVVDRMGGVRRRPRNLARNVAIAGIALVVIGTIVYFPLKLRDPQMTPFGALDSVFEYVSGPLGALNLYVIQHPLVTPSRPEFGGYTFWGAASILLRLGVPVSLPPNWLEFVPYQAHGERLSNVYTWLIYFVLDFGWVGAIVIPYLFGVVATSVHYLVVIRGRRDLIAPACILMVQLIMSFFAFSLLRDLRFWSVMLFSPYLVRTVLARTPGPRPKLTPSITSHNLSKC